MQALAKAQGSYKKLIANEDSPSGKFANLQAILEATREALSANELAFYQNIELLEDGTGATLLHTNLGHGSGQWISSTARVVVGKIDRQNGNSIEFYKRAHACAILGVAPSTTDPELFDDNGEQQFEHQTVEGLKKSPDGKLPKEVREEVISNDRYNTLMWELESFDDLAKDIMEKYSIESLADLPNSEYHRVFAQIKRIKTTHERYLNRK
jgi:hypothetical protein